MGLQWYLTPLKKQMCCQFHIKDNVEVIYNFFVPQEDIIGKKPFRDLFVSGNQKLLVHASNFRPVKRPTDLVHILKAVRKKMDCRLLLLGAGEGMEEIRTLAAEFNVLDEIIFLGKSREIDPYIASGDLFLLPSALESFGLAALEAMAYGLPVVASDAGGIPELVLQGKTGLLAPIGEVQQMADDVVELLSDERKYQEFSKASQERAANEFSAEKIVSQYEAYYQKILMGH